MKDIKSLKFNATTTGSGGIGGTRNSGLNRKDMSTNLWKPAQSLPAPIELEETVNPTFAFGSGQFFKGLKNEINSLDK